MSVEYMLGDHLGSTSLTTDKNGVKTSEMRYCEASLWDKPWGEVRSWWTSALATTPAYKLADYTFTGQYSYMDDPSTSGTTEGFGLMFYNARWYDPALGRFTSADTIIPQSQGVQGLDRYAYANNSPVIYVDPSGHFTEKQLEDWFGPKWLDKFSPVMLSFLYEAELGDILHGNNLSIMFVLDQSGVLGAWDLSSKALQDIANYNDVNPKSAALYRPKSASDGPTDTDWNPLPNPGLGEGIGNPAYSNPPYEQVYNLGCNTCSESYELPHGWYQGENNGVYVEVFGGPVRIDFSGWDWLMTGGSISELGRMIVPVLKTGVPNAGIFGPAGILTITVLDSLQWDTLYMVRNGNMAPVPLSGIPTPP